MTAPSPIPTPHAASGNVRTGADARNPERAGGASGARFVLHHVDCLGPDGLATLADGSVEHVICDPPYSEHVHTKLGREGRGDGAASREALSFAALTDEIVEMTATHLCRIARRWILIFCDEVSFAQWRAAILRQGGEYVRQGGWIKDDAMPQMSGDRPSAGIENIVIAHAQRPPSRAKQWSGKRGDAFRDRLRWNGGGRPAVWAGSVRDAATPRQHPTQKPLWLMESLTRDFTDPGETILDPFAGSGTTGAAALRLGRRFIGYERDAKYAAIAQKRLESTREQSELFASRQPRAKQAALFGGGGK